MAGSSVEISGAGNPSLSRIRAGTLQVPLNLVATNSVTTTNTQVVGTSRGIELNALTGKFLYLQSAGVGFKMGNYGTYLGSPKVYIGTDTSAGSDTYSFTLVGAGDSDATRGAALTLFGIDHPDTRKGCVVVSVPKDKELRFIGDASSGSTAYDVVLSSSGLAVSNNASRYRATFSASGLSADRAITIPNSAGTLVVTSTGAVSLSDLTAGTLAVALNLPSGLSVTSANRQIVGTSTGIHYNVPSGLNHTFLIANTTAYTVVGGGFKLGQTGMGGVAGAVTHGPLSLGNSNTLTVMTVSSSRSGWLFVSDNTGQYCRLRVTGTGPPTIEVGSGNFEVAASPSTNASLAWNVSGSNLQLIAGSAAGTSLSYVWIGTP